MPRALRYPLVALLAVGLGLGAVVGGHHLLKWRAYRAYLARRAVDRATPRTEPLGPDSLLVRNPVYEVGQDPWVTRVDADTAAPYHYVYTDRATNALYVERAADVLAFGRDAPYFTWAPADDPATAALTLLWAPELHRVGGRWVIYVAAKPTADLLAPSHRMHALVARDDDDLTRGFDHVGALALPGDAWAIDGTAFRHRGRDYHVWSGWTDGERLDQSLYICAMDDALTPRGERVRISAPTHDWELRGRRLGLWPRINEGPAQLSRGGRDFLVYAASGSWSDHYALGLLELVGDDPLDPAAWRKAPEPLLAPTDEVPGPGHASFVERAGEVLCVYHAARYSRAGWDREVHVAPVRFDAAGWPSVDGPRREVVLAR